MTQTSSSLALSNMVVVSAEQMDACRDLIEDAIDAGFTRVALLEAKNDEETRRVVDYIVSSLTKEDERLTFEWEPTRQALAAAIGGNARAQTAAALPQTYQLVVSWEAAVKRIVEYNKARRHLL